MSAPQIIAASFIMIAFSISIGRAGHALWMATKMRRWNFTNSYHLQLALRMAGTALGLALWGLVLQWGGFWS